MQTQNSLGSWSHFNLHSMHVHLMSAFYLCFQSVKPSYALSVKSAPELSSLPTLRLQRKECAGVLPSDWSNMTKLRTLDVSVNRLWGNKHLHIARAHLLLSTLGCYHRSRLKGWVLLLGRLPQSWQNLESMRYLGLLNNTLTGGVSVLKIHQIY